MCLHIFVLKVVRGASMSKSVRLNVNIIKAQHPFVNRPLEEYGCFLGKDTPKGNFLKKVPLWNPLKNFVTGVIAIRCKATIFKQCEFCLIGRRSLFKKSSAKTLLLGVMAMRRGTQKRSSKKRFYTSATKIQLDRIQIFYICGSIYFKSPKFLL